MIVRPAPNEDNPLSEYFRRNNGRIIDKWHHYCDIYHNRFHRLHGQAMTVLEIGVFRRGSLQMWKNYFGPRARLFGVDTDTRRKVLEEGQVRVLIGDRADRAFLRRLREEIGPIDVVISPILPASRHCR